MFLEWDTDNDGYISRSELKRHLKEVSETFNVEPPDIMALLRAADADKDGLIDYTEFITAAFDKRKLLTEPMIIQAFKLLDCDADGTISINDLKNAFNSATFNSTSDDTLWQEMLAEADAN
mmetsp:Transcript_39193/g.51275  ORF Transcript_39193/g.51275 Transcript_39193/m.51275 type:complete len:121 (+) Transcript_39193:211-573(+)|eukprot:CAMPEP_0185594366 /NCGR_PEP_ID=MMETSP0434-20130131/74582_1 /TAXON_ID=626734 ORGANISM="Favella taraikaensis, Strain Fe Narragansett Bay" /NCGR_SAMPLE_ID=MMETSP0434 /ASSEMBLY_ACC=CAM_ASM_000379 /LENGTH=120 /DNA_ID=CAMNT_0028221627 /DNA_START=189 /DNA_END=551 /DNA_ORIENTATION=-